MSHADSGPRDEIRIASGPNAGERYSVAAGMASLNLLTPDGKAVAHYRRMPARPGERVYCFAHYGTAAGRC